LFVFRWVEKFYFVFLVLGIFAEMFCKESNLLEEEKFFIAKVGQFVLGCFFGLGFD